jgi:uncharacterized protein
MTPDAPSVAAADLAPRFLGGVLCHVAIPCLDLEAARAFYVDVLGATLFREYDDRKTYGWANLQIVTHLCSEQDVLWNPQVYPRHFGLTFADLAAFEAMVQRAERAQVPMILPPQRRFPGRREQHFTCIVRDPSHNLVEFKCYDDPAMAF